MWASSSLTASPHGRQLNYPTRPGRRTALGYRLVLLYHICGASGNREGVQDLGVLITEGQSTWDMAQLPYEAWETHIAGIQVGASISYNEPVYS